MKYVILVLLAVSVAAAQPGPFGGGRGFDGKGICAMEQKLDLSADQQKQFETFRSDMQKKQIDLSAKIKTLRVEIRDLYGNENPDQKAIESKMSEISRLQNEMKLNHTDFWFSVNKILTPEQKKIWMERGQMDGRGFREGARRNFGPRGGRGDGFGRGRGDGFGRGWGDGFDGGRHYRSRDGSCR